MGTYLSNEFILMGTYLNVNIKGTYFYINILYGYIYSTNS